MLGRPMAVGDLTVAVGLRIRFIVIDWQGAGRYPKWKIGTNAENYVNHLVPRFAGFGERAGPLAVGPRCIVRMRRVDTILCCVMHFRRARSTRKKGFSGFRRLHTKYYDCPVSRTLHCPFLRIPPRPVPETSTLPGSGDTTLSSSTDIVLATPYLIDCHSLSLRSLKQSSKSILSRKLS